MTPTSSSSAAMSLLTQSAYICPLLMVFLVGIVLALARWQRHPAASGFALSGFIVLLSNAVLMLVIQVFVVDNMSRRGGTNAQLGTILSVVNMARILINVIGYSLLIVAVFIGRSARPRRTEPELPDGPSKAPSVVPADRPQTAYRERMS